MFLLLASTLIATAQEVQVPFDREGKVFVITKTFNDKHAVFPGIEGFIEARLFKLTIDTYNVEFAREVNGQRLRDNQPLTQTDVDSLRTRMAVYLAEDAYAEAAEEESDASGLDQSGRTALLWGSTLWGLFYYGTATSIALDVSEPAIPILLAGGLGYLVPAILTNNAPVTDGAASLALGGMFQGTIHGWALAALIQGESLFEDETPRLGFGLSVLTGVAETFIGYTVATNTKMSEGRASVINTTAFYGLWCGGLLTGAIFDQVEPSSDVAARTLGAAALVGTAAGVIIGNSIADGQHYTSGDASMYGITGFFGAALPWVTLATIQPDDISGTLVSTLSIATTIGGLWLGNELVRGKDYRSTDGTISVLSLLGGGLIGLGIATAIDDENAYPALTYAGALGGFGISLAMAKPRVDTKSTSALDVNVNPLGPLMLQRSADGIVRPSPFVTARYRF